MLQSQAVLAVDADAVVRPFFGPCPDFRHFQLPFLGRCQAVSTVKRGNMASPGIAWWCYPKLG